MKCPLLLMAKTVPSECVEKECAWWVDAREHSGCGVLILIQRVAFPPSLCYSAPAVIKE